MQSKHIEEIQNNVTYIVGQYRHEEDEKVIVLPKRLFKS